MSADKVCFYGEIKKNYAGIIILYKSAGFRHSLYGSFINVQWTCIFIQALFKQGHV